ncbi:hypothetical protein [Schlesneria paludicola]|uniref:hypothetical protein n=1 Tax=Schlesneria paludicola TaxID=360056 RepID=UPI00029A3B03|nr:hypothetical protein [Schlesneria paludicola]
MSDWMPDLNFLSLILSAVALWIAWLAYRVTATVWIQAIGFDGAGRWNHTENGGKLFHCFDVILRNRGLAVHGLKVNLLFEADDTEYSFQLSQVEYRKREVIVKDNGPFESGMIAVFSLKSHFYEQALATAVKSMAGMMSSRFRLGIYSQDYLIAEIPLWVRFGTLKNSWNYIAWRLEKWIGREGVIPIFKSPAAKHICDFVEAMRSSSHLPPSREPLTTPMDYGKNVGPK